MCVQISINTVILFFEILFSSCSVLFNEKMQHTRVPGFMIRQESYNLFSRVIFNLCVLCRLCFWNLLWQVRHYTNNTVGKIYATPVHCQIITFSLHHRLAFVRLFTTSHNKQISMYCPRVLQRSRNWVQWCVCPKKIRKYIKYLKYPTQKTQQKTSSSRKYPCVRAWLRTRYINKNMLTLCWLAKIYAWLVAILSSLFSSLFALSLNRLSFPYFLYVVAYLPSHQIYIITFWAVFSPSFLRHFYSITL